LKFIEEANKSKENIKNKEAKLEMVKKLEIIMKDYRIACGKFFYGENAKAVIEEAYIGDNNAAGAQFGILDVPKKVKEEVNKSSSEKAREKFLQFCDLPPELHILERKLLKEIYNESYPTRVNIIKELEKSWQETSESFKKIFNDCKQQHIIEPFRNTYISYQEQFQSHIRKCFSDPERWWDNYKNIFGCIKLFRTVEENLEKTVTSQTLPEDT
jgi:hypothetical protein